MVRSERKEKWIIYILALLLCMVLASFWLLCGIYARYSSQGSGSDSARVATFVFDVNSEAQTGSIAIQDIKKPGDTAVYTIEITNKNASGRISEVTESYTIEASINGSMPLSCTMKKDDTEVFSIKNYETGKDASKQVNDPKTTKQTFSGATEQTDSYQLEVTWPSDMKDAVYANGSGQAEVVITVTGVQAD